MDPDPAIFVLNLQDANKKTFFSVFLLITPWRYIYITLTIKKVAKVSQNSRNQSFSYYFCLMIEGSGSKRPKNVRSGSGSTGFLSKILKRILIHMTSGFSLTPYSTPTHAKKYWENEISPRHPPVQIGPFFPRVKCVRVGVRWNSTTYIMFIVRQPFPFIRLVAVGSRPLDTTHTIITYTISLSLLEESAPRPPSSPLIWKVENKAKTRGQILSLWLVDKVDSGIGLRSTLAQYYPW